MHKKILFLFVSAVIGLSFFVSNANAQVGSLFVALDPATPSSSVIAANSADVEFAKFKLTATGEDINITSIKLTASASSSVNLINIKLFDGSTQLGWTIASPSNGTATFSSYSLVRIPANSFKTLTVKASVTGSGSVSLGIQNSSADISAVGQTSAYTIYPTPSTAVFGNTMTVSGSVGTSTSLPDLIISDFLWTPLTPTVSQTDSYIYFSFTVKNIGNTAVTIPTNTEYVLYKGSVSPANKAWVVIIGTGVITLEPNQSQAYSNRSTMQFPNIRAEAGTFNLIMAADATNLIQESNESNNSMTKSITIGIAETSKPDLTVLDIYDDNGKLSVKIGNIGSGAAPSGVGHLYIWIDDQLEWTYSLSTLYDQSFLNPGGTMVGQPQVLSGQHKIKAVIDPNGAITESNENNNTLEKTLTFGTSTATATTTTASIKVISPNGGERLEIGKAYNVKWNASGLEKVNIILWSADPINPGAYKGARLASDINASVGNYTWVVPEKTECLSLPCLFLNEYGDHMIEVVDVRYGRDSAFPLKISDMSDAPFYITIQKASLPDLIIKDLKVDPPSPVLNQKATISFIIQNIGASPTVPLWGGADIQPVYPPLILGVYDDCKQKTLNTGDSCTVRQDFTFQTVGSFTINRQVSSGNNLDESNAFNNAAALSFQVVQSPNLSVALFSPLGGEQWYAGGAYDIKWSSIGTEPTKSIFLRNQNALSLVQIGSFTSVSNDGSYSWKIHESFAKEPGKYKVILSAPTKENNNRFVSAESGVFSILSSNTIPATPAVPTVVSGTSTVTAIPATPAVPVSILQEGTLVKSPSSPDVYVIRNGQKVRINSPQEFEQAGYKWDQIKEIQSDLLKQIAELKAEVKKLKEKLLRTGALLKAQGIPDVYVVQEGTKVKINNPEEFNQKGYKWDQIKEVTNEELASIPNYLPAEKEPISYPNGTLIKSKDSPTVYVIINGKKKPIPDPATFNKLGYKWERIKMVEVDELPKIQDATAVQLNTVSPPSVLSFDIVPGMLVKSLDSPMVYFITSNQLKKPIPNIEVFNSYKNKWENVKVADPKILADVPAINAIQLQGEDQIYLIENNVKRLIASEEAFTKLEPTLRLVQVNKIEFDSYKTGEEIK